MTNTGGIKLSITKDLVEFLSLKNTTLTDLFVIYCMETKGESFELLKVFFSRKTDIQKEAFLQGLIRKRLLSKFSEDVLFDYDNYYLTDNAEKILEETQLHFNDLEKVFDTKFIEQEESTEEVDTKRLAIKELVKSFIDLFPVGKKNQYGYYLRANEVDVTSKMITFKRKYTKYDDETILNATKAYLDKQKRNDYQYCSRADFFILKHSISILASECEGIKNSPEDLETDYDIFNNRLM